MISHLTNHASATGRNNVRNGFTLVELLIVVSIIGLLVGMLVAVGGPAITRAREFAVTNEMQQMSGAVEHFKTTYGFYPPSFERINTPNQLLPYLNKISPTHRELELLGGATGPTRLQNWWDRVGINLNQQTSLQFWLAGLAKNKQYPLTGGFAQIPVGFNSPTFVEDGTEITTGFEREVFFDFDQERLIPLGDGTAQYIMSHGKTNGDLFYLYRDSDSYFDQNPSIPPNWLPAYHFIDLNGNVVFANADTFQIISAGMDGDFGINDSEPGLLFNLESRVQEFQLPKSADNLCNFAEGRLDKFINEKQ